MGYGDELLAAGQAQRLYDTTHKRVLICDRRQRPRWHEIWQDNPAIVNPLIPAERKRLDAASHVADRYVSLINGPGIRPYLTNNPMTREGGWKFNRAFRARDHLAKIYLTPAEWQLGQEARENFGPYVLIEPWSAHPNLRWPLVHWEALVADRQDLTFLQHTHRHTRDCLVPGAVPLATASFREACGLLASAECYIRGESGMLHAAAALGIPAVAIWGGCMDWEVLGGYPQQVGVGISHPACGSYLPCAHCAAIMHAIVPEAVSSAIALATRWAGQVALQ